MQKCPKHRSNGHGQGVSTGCGSTLCPFYSSCSQIGWVTFSLGRWGAVLARNPTQGPLEHTLGMGLGTVFTRACFSWGKLFAKRKGSSSGNAEYISQTPVLFTDSRRSQRTEQVSHEDSFCEHLVQLCPLGMWALVKMAAGHLCILKLLLCDPLPVCCFPSCLRGEESLQKSQQCIKTALYFMTNGVMLCASLCTTLYSHNKDSIINKHKRWKTRRC